MNSKIATEMEKFLLKNSTCLISCINYIYKGQIDRYVFLYAVKWPFCYLPGTLYDVTDIGNRIVYADDKLTNKLLNTFGGVEVYFEKNCLDKSLIKIKSTSKDKFIFLGLDAFYCNWSPAYKEKHILHNILIKGFDENNSEYICIDPFSGSICDLRLPESEVIRGYENIRVIHFSDNKKDMNVEKAIMLFRRNYDEKRLKFCFQTFEEDLCHARKLEDLFDSSHPETCAIIRRCKEITISRIGISLMTYYIYKNENYEGFLELSELMYQSAGLWKGCSLLLMRMLLKKSISDAVLQKISDMIEQIASLELTYGRLIDGKI